MEERQIDCLGRDGEYDDSRDQADSPRLPFGASHPFSVREHDDASQPSHSHTHSHSPSRRHVHRQHTAYRRDSVDTSDENEAELDAAAAEAEAEDEDEDRSNGDDGGDSTHDKPVSYTHLTLPTT